MDRQTGSAPEPAAFASRLAVHGIRFGRAELVLILGAALLAAFTAYTYYDDLLRPLAHTLGLWVALVVVVAAGHPVAQAALRSILALLAAVITFYVGKKVVHDIIHPTSSYDLAIDDITLWSLLAVVAGATLGSALSRIGRPDWGGAAATALAIGLVVGDALRRGLDRASEVPVLSIVSVVAIAVVLSMGSRSPRVLCRVLLLAVPATAFGYGLVLTPNAIEQFLVTGSF